MKSMLRKYAVYINRHRAEVSGGKCSNNQQGALETFRISTLLSGQSIVVSAPSFPSDEEEFKDIVLFDKNFYSGTWSAQRI